MKLKLPKKAEGGDIDDQGPGKPRKAIAVSNKNDPRLRAYQDSAKLYNTTVAMDNFVKANPDYAAVQANPALKAQYDKLYEDNIGGNLYSDRKNYNPIGKRDVYKGEENWIFAKPVQPYQYEQPTPKEAERSNVQQAQSLNPGIGAINPVVTQLPQAGGPTNFSFTGRDDNGQQATRYFPDLASWQNATEQMGYRDRTVTNNGQQANATGYQFNKGGLMKAATGLPALAQTATGPQDIPNWAANMSQGFIHPTTPTPQLQQNGNISQQYPQDAGGTSFNWDHILNSQVAQNVASGLVSRFSPNSQQNTIQEFNRNQFNPMNYLPYTPNNSIQAQYGTQGMRRGGLVKAEFGGDLSDEMRKWILDDDAPAPVEEEVQPEQQAPEYNDALEYANYMQMFPDQTEEQDQPDEQYMYKKGGIHIKKSHEGRFTAYKKRTGKTTEEALHSKDPHVRKMAQFAKNASKWHHKEGGLVQFEEGGEYNMTKQDLDYYRSMGYEIDEI